MFREIDLANWERREYFLHYLNRVNCTYSATVRLDITPLKGQKLYPAMLWLLTGTVNEMPQFRTAFQGERLGVYDEMHPAYTIFHPERGNFSCVFTEYSGDYKVFLERYQRTAETCRGAEGLLPQKGRPENTFDISMIPWFSFTSFNLNINGDGRYLLPIFTMGRAAEENGKWLLPLAIQVHHAVCDGYHVAQFLQKLQGAVERFEGNIPNCKKT